MPGTRSPQHRKRIVKEAEALQHRVAALLDEARNRPGVTDEALAEIEAIIEAVADVDEEIERRRREERLRFAWKPALAFAVAFRREFQRIDVDAQTLTEAQVRDYIERNAFKSVAKELGFSLTRKSLAALLADGMTPGRWLRRQIATGLGRSEATVRNILLFRRR